jgi:hypothetical protein
MPHVRPLGDKLWEMRLRDADGIAWAIYFTTSGRRMVVLHAFEKRAQRTPRRSLDLASGLGMADRAPSPRGLHSGMCQPFGRRDRRQDCYRPVILLTELASKGRLRFEISLLCAPVLRANQPILGVADARSRWALSRRSSGGTTRQDCLAAGLRREFAE